MPLNYNTPNNLNKLFSPESSGVPTLAQIRQKHLARVKIGNPYSLSNVAIRLNKSVQLTIANIVDIIRKEFAVVTLKHNSSLFSNCFHLEEPRTKRACEIGIDWSEFDSKYNLVLLYNIPANIIQLIAFDICEAIDDARMEADLRPDTRWQTFQAPFKSNDLITFVN